MEKSSRVQWRLRPDFSSDWSFLPAKGLVDGVISPVGGGFCPLRGWFASVFLQRVGNLGGLSRTQW